MLSAVRRHFPWMAPWADTCYRHDSNLLVGGSCIQSRRGVQQGDPLGPSLFSLAVPPSIVEAARISEAQFHGDLDYKAFFLDDGTIAGKAQQLNCFWTLSSAPSSTVGLSSHATKPRWFLLALLFRTSLRKISRAAAGYQMVISSYWGRLLVPRIGARLFSTGGFCKARSLLEAIGRYHDSQGAFALMLSCTGWAKILYSCRTVPPPLQAAGLCNADRDIRHSLGRLVGSPLSDEDWRLASLGVASGGLGALLSMLRLLMLPAWPSPRNCVHAFGRVSTSMTLTVVYFELTLSPP